MCLACQKFGGCYTEKGENMKKKSLLILIAITSLSVFANNDLTINGNRWEAKIIGYRCGAFRDESNGPASHTELTNSIRHLQLNEF